MNPIALDTMTDEELDEFRLDLEHDIEFDDGDTYRMAMLLETIEAEIAWRFGKAIGAVP